MSYLPCELHCHTVHSDGDFQVKELLQAASDDHLSLIALTDHNTSSGCAELDDGITPAIKGIEWTTYFGHMLVLGAKRFVDWRDAVPDNIDEKISEVKESGGLVGIAHPFQLGSPMCTGGRWEFHIKDWNSVDYMEIWHEAFSENNYENDRALRLWTSLLDRGYRLAATYGRDWHRPARSGHFGCTYLNIDGEVNEQTALNAIQKGRTVVSCGAKFFFKVHQNGQIYDIGDSIPAGTAVFSFFTDELARRKNVGTERVVYQKVKVVTNGGVCIGTSGITQKQLNLPLESHHWYRGELWGTVNGQEHLLAVTSPVYTE